MDKFVCALFFLLTASAATADGFNAYIVKSVEFIHDQRAKGGYDIKKAFYDDLQYGSECCIKSSPGHETMCVAAVEEIIVEAMNIYRQETGSDGAHKQIPISSWTKGTPISLRANLFMFAGTGSKGTGHTLERFGLGQQIAFDALQSGDFINFNRTNRTGHAVVFISYLESDGVAVKQYADSVVGFRYFSAQGRGKPDAGFGFRDAFFDGYCPTTPTEYPKDCKIIRSNSKTLLSAGRMAAPDAWNYTAAVAKLKEEYEANLTRGLSPDAARAIHTAIPELLEQEMPQEFLYDDYFNGETVEAE